jgi:hypothetical protein
LPPPYSAGFLNSIQRTITTERLTRYLGATRQDISHALELYEYNVQLSEILYGLLHSLEVTLRNAEHHALTASYGNPRWYDIAPLSPYWQDQVADAKVKPGAAGKPGKVVAELTFGFWVDLTSRHNHNSLWMGKRLNAAFPHTTLRRDAIHDRLKSVQLLRNRISHHEPILTSARALYNGNGVLRLQQLLECVEWICPDTAQWIRSQFRYVEAERILNTVNGSGVTL